MKQPQFETLVELKLIEAQLLEQTQVQSLQVCVELGSQSHLSGKIKVEAGKQVDMRSLVKVEFSNPNIHKSIMVTLLPESTGKSGRWIHADTVSTAIPVRAILKIGSNSKKYFSYPLFCKSELRGSIKVRVMVINREAEDSNSSGYPKAMVLKQKYVFSRPVVAKESLIITNSNQKSFEEAEDMDLASKLQQIEDQLKIHSEKRPGRQGTNLRAFGTITEEELEYQSEESNP